MEKDLLKELMILAAKRSIKPNVAWNERMQEILNQLYELTGDEIYKL
jgi:hypothetical protein